MCPLCKQFVYMPHNMFLRTRVKNLQWKLDRLREQPDLNLHTIDMYKSMITRIERVLIDEPMNEPANRLADDLLCQFNTIVQNWYWYYYT